MKQDWEIKKLGDCFEYIKNGANIKQERDAGGIPITRIETLSGGVFNRDRLGYADIETIDKYQSYVMESGDLLLSHINSKSYIGRMVVYVKEGDETIIHGMNLLRLKVVSDLISPFYMYYYSQTHKFKSQIANRRKDAVNQSSISVADLKTIDVPVPSREEQERIVAELDCLSGVIEKKRQQLKELDALAQSIFYTMFGDPITNEKGWEVKKLGEVAQIVSGGTPSRKNAEYFTGDINWYSAGELNSMFLSDSIEKITQNALDETSAKLFQKGSLLVGMYDTAAFKLGILEKASSSNQACANIALHEDNVIWLYYVLMLMKDEALKHRHGARQKNLNVGFIKDFTIPLPPLTLQQQFASKIEAIEKQKELIKQSIKDTEELFDSRMDYYFN